MPPQARRPAQPLGLMAAHLILEDGRPFYASSLGFEGMLILAARELPEEFGKLRMWLLDKGSRPGALQGFDIRGLDTLHRSAFWRACSQAYVRLQEKYGDFSSLPDNAYAAACVAGVNEAHLSVEAGEPPPIIDGERKTFEFDGEMQNLDDLWKLYET